jgi:hypothetical protein
VQPLLNFARHDYIEDLLAVGDRFIHDVGLIRVGHPLFDGSVKSPDNFQQMFV